MGPEALFRVLLLASVILALGRYPVFGYLDPSGGISVWDFALGHGRIAG